MLADDLKQLVNLLEEYGDKHAGGERPGGKECKVITEACIGLVASTLDAVRQKETLDRLHNQTQQQALRGRRP